MSLRPSIGTGLKYLPLLFMTITSLFLNPLLNFFAVLMERNEAKAAAESLGNMKYKQAENWQVNLKAKGDVNVSHAA